MINNQPEVWKEWSLSTLPIGLGGGRLRHKGNFTFVHNRKSRG
jgi:hypothetical protein